MSFPGSQPGTCRYVAPLLCFRFVCFVFWSIRIKISRCSLGWRLNNVTATAVGVKKLSTTFLHSLRFEKKKNLHVFWLLLFSGIHIIFPFYFLISRVGRYFFNYLLSEDSQVIVFQFLVPSFYFFKCSFYIYRATVVVVVCLLLPVITETSGVDCLVTVSLMLWLIVISTYTSIPT